MPDDDDYRDFWEDGHYLVDTFEPKHLPDFYSYQEDATRAFAFEWCIREGYIEE